MEPRRRLGAIVAHLQAAAARRSPEAGRAARRAAAQRGGGGATPDSPRGPGLQGFGLLSPEQPPVFDPVVQHEEALSFYSEQGYVVVNALSQAQVLEMNALADRWLEEYAADPAAATLFYPLPDYPGVDKFITHPRTFPLISAILGGEDFVRFCEFNWRGFPRGHGRQGHDGSPPAAGASGMSFHPDASLPDRHTREPYGPPDYCVGGNFRPVLCLGMKLTLLLPQSAFYYLTDTNPNTPCFCVVPRSMRYRTLTKAKEALGGSYAEQPIYGRAGTCILVDTAIFHTRLDGDGEEPRRLMHHAFARGGWLQLGDGSFRAPSPVNNPHNLIPQRLACHPDQVVRKLYCLWSASMAEWAASGFDESYRSRRPTKGSPNPATRKVLDKT